MNNAAENFDPKPKRKNDETRKGHPRRLRLLLVAAIVIAAITGFAASRPRFVPMTDPPKYRLLYHIGPPHFTTYRVDFQTGEREVVDESYVRQFDDRAPSMSGVSPLSPAWIENGEYIVEGSISPSPEGTQVVYISTQDGYGRVYIMDLATGKSRLITPYQDGRNPQWSPDGKWIAFEAYYRANPLDRMVNDVDVYIVRVDGFYSQSVSNGPTPMETLIGWEPLPE